MEISITGRMVREGLRIGCFGVRKFWNIIFALFTHLATIDEFQFPINLAQRKALWDKALKISGLDKQLRDSNNSSE